MYQGNAIKGQKHLRVTAIGMHQKDTLEVKQHFINMAYKRPYFIARKSFYFSY